MKIAEAICTPFKRSLLDLFWPCPATFRIFLSVETSWNQLNNWRKNFPVSDVNKLLFNDDNDNYVVQNNTLSWIFLVLT